MKAVEIVGTGRSRWDAGEAARVSVSDAQVVLQPPVVGWWRGDPHEARALAYAILNAADAAQFPRGRPVGVEAS